MSFRNIQRAIWLLVAVFSLPACSTRQPAATDTIYVSILPLRGLVHEIVGDDLPIEVLVPAGASPESFEPTPRQFVALNEAQLVCSVGLIDFETTLLQKLDNPQKLVNLSEGVDLLAGSCSHGHGLEQAHTHGHDGHHHAHGIDPHIWTSPRALRQMAAHAYEAIRIHYPDSTKYERNYLNLCEKIDSLDAQTARRIAASGVQLIVLYHPALTYYARDYGVQQLAIEEDGKEPSARHLARLIEQARANQVRRIFYQSQFPASTVEVIAGDIGAEAVQIDPLREDVLANIEEITRLITEQ